MIENLAEFELIDGLEPAYLDYLTGQGSSVTFESGHTLFKKGQPADEFYFIQEGKIALGTFVSGRGFMTIQVLEPGNLLGWSWLVPPYTWRFEALTITPVQAIAFDGKRLRDKCETDRDFGYEIFKRVATIIGERLKVTRRRLSG